MSGLRDLQIQGRQHKSTSFFLSFLKNFIVKEMMIMIFKIHVEER